MENKIIYAKTIAKQIFAEYDIDSIYLQAKLTKHAKKTLNAINLNITCGQHLFAGEFFDDNLNKLFSHPENLSLPSKCKSFLLGICNAEQYSLPEFIIQTKQHFDDFTHIIIKKAVQFILQEQFSKLAHALQLQDNILFTSAFLITAETDTTSQTTLTKLERFSNLPEGIYTSALIMGIYHDKNIGTDTGCGSCNKQCTSCNKH